MKPITIGLEACPRCSGVDVWVGRGVDVWSAVFMGGGALVGVSVYGRVGRGPVAGLQPMSVRLNKVKKMIRMMVFNKLLFINRFYLS